MVNPHNHDTSFVQTVIYYLSKYKSERAIRMQVQTDRRTFKHMISARRWLRVLDLFLLQFVHWWYGNYFGCGCEPLEIIENKGRIWRLTTFNCTLLKQGEDNQSIYYFSCFWIGEAGSQSSKPLASYLCDRVYVNLHPSMIVSVIMPQ